MLKYPLIWRNMLKQAYFTFPHDHRTVKIMNSKYANIWCNMLRCAVIC